MRIGIGNTVPERSNLPGQSGGGIPYDFQFEVTGAVTIKAQPAATGQSFTIKWPNGTEQTTTGSNSIPAPDSTAGVVSINKKTDTTYADEFAIVGGQSLVTKVLSWGQNSWNSLSNAFENCTNLTEIGETSLITDSIGNLDYAFKGCTSLTSVNMTPWNLSQGLRARELFAGCTNIAQIDWTGVARLSNSIAGMFKDVGTTVAAGCNFQTNNLDFSSSAVVTTGGTSAAGDGMFTNALIDADNSDISNWDFRTNIININLLHTFRNARVVGDDKTLNISNWKMDCTGTMNLSLMFDQFNEDPGNVRTDHNLSLNMTNWQFGSGTTKSLFSQAFKLANFRKIIGLNTWTSGVVERAEYMFQSTNFWAIQEGDNFSDAFWANSALVNGMVGMFQFHGLDLAESDWGESPNIKGLSKSTTTTSNQNVAQMFQSARYTTTLSFEDVDFATGYGAANGTLINYHIYAIKIKKNGVVSGGVDYSNAKIKFTGTSYANWASAEISFLTFGPDIDFTLMTTWPVAFNNAFPDWPLTFATNLNLTNLTSIGLSRTLTPCQADNFIRAVHDTNYLIGAPTPFSFSLGNSQVTNSPSVVNSKLLALEAAGYTITDGNPGTTMPFEYTTPININTPATPSGSFTGGQFSSSNGDIQVNDTTGEIDTPNSGSTTIRYTITATGCYNEQAINVVGQLNNVYSMEFDGASDFIDAGTGVGNALGSSVTNFSVSGWFKTSLNPLPSNEGMFAFGDHTSSTSNSPFHFYQASYNNFDVFFANLQYHRYIVNVYTGGVRWINYIISYDGTQGASADRLKLYIDGVFLVPNTIGGTIPTSINFTNNTNTIGVSAQNKYYNGSIDELAVFNYSLTEAEALSIYNATEAGKTADLNDLTTPPIAWYRMGD